MAAATTTSPAPDGAFLLAHPAHFIALGCGAGLVPKAPGTAGTLVAFPLYWLLATIMPPLAVAFCAVPLFLLGIWASDRTARDLGVQDHGAIVIDEIAAFLPLLALSSLSIWLQLVTFALFRLFDIWKPFPIRQVERQVAGGLGVMLDDAIAAMYAYVVFAVAVLVVVKSVG